MRALADAPVAGVQSFKCPHCHRIQKTAVADDGHPSPSIVEPGQP
jgi:hypothetical protein